MAQEFFSPAKTASRTTETSEPSFTKGIKGEPFFKSAADKENAFFKPSGLTSLSSAGTANPIQKKGQKDGNLPEGIQMKMENSFGEDFSDVKIFQNSEQARNLNAVAYTQGNEINFKPGFDPFSSNGEEVLGHELSHVVQQRSGEVSTTHFENGLPVNSSDHLEQRADIEGKKAVNGQKISNSSRGLASAKTVQKKSPAIQMWRDHPGQWRVERTVNPDTDAAWTAVASAINQVAGGFSGGITEEFRGLFYAKISGELSGRLGTIPISNFKSYSGPNLTWSGTISFKIDGEREIAGGGTGTTTLGGGGTTTTGSTTTDTQGGGNTGGATGTSAPAGSTGGTGGNVTAGASSSSSNSRADSISQTENATSASAINHNLPRFSARMACFVHLSASSAFGDSGFDYVNPFAMIAGAGAGIGTTINGSGDASANCGEVIYFQGNGIAPIPVPAPAPVPSH